MTEKPRETQAELHVVELKEKVNNSSLMKHTTRPSPCRLATYEHRSFKQGPVGRGAGEGKFRYGRETLQEGLKKAFQHLQSNQKNYR